MSSAMRTAAPPTAPQRAATRLAPPSSIDSAHERARPIGWRAKATLLKASMPAQRWPW
jgi:hypothetical protein